MTYAPLSWQEWRDQNREEAGGGIEFSHHSCELCGALPGSRYHVAAYKEKFPEDTDYIALEVCGDCLMYIVNGDVPNEVED